MSKSNLRISSIMAAALAVVASIFNGSAHADGDYDVKHIMEGLPASERVTYMMGVIEGLAYARLQQDDKKTEGMKCIYDWFFENKNAADTVFNAFAQFPQYTPGAIIGAMVQKKCGK